MLPSIICLKVPPAAVEGSVEVQRHAFQKVFNDSMARVRLLPALPLTIKREMDRIGQIKDTY